MPTPALCSTPSRVIQVFNMLRVPDLFDPEFIDEVKNDLLQECKPYGDVVSIEVPLPQTNMAVEGDRLDNTVLVSHAHGKIFVKFSHIVSAKQARYNLSGRQYNNRTVVVSFYPEHYFDIHEFSIV